MSQRKTEEDSLVIVSESKYYAEYRKACADTLSALGWKVHVQDDFRNISSYDGLLVIGISFFRWPTFVPGQFRVGLSGEHMPLPGDTDWSLYRNRKRFRAMSGYYDLVIDWSPGNYIQTSCSSPYMYLPHGAPEASNQRKTEEWDVVFLGNPFGSNGRRQGFLRALEKEFNCCPTREAWGVEKYRLINAAKICLNLHQFASASFESPRVFELLSEGAFVLSEKIDCSLPFVEGRDFVSFSDKNEMIEKAHYYLQNPEARIAIAEAGKRTALGFQQEEMFNLLSIELHRCKNKKRHLVPSFSSWSGGILRNSIIEIIDLAAKLKRDLLNKVKK